MRLINASHYPEMNTLIGECVNNIFDCQVFDQNGAILETTPDSKSGNTVLESESAVYKVQMNCIDVALDNLFNRSLNSELYTEFCNNLEKAIACLVTKHPEARNNMTRFIGGYAGSRVVSKSVRSIIVIPMPSSNEKACDKCWIRFDGDYVYSTYNPRDNHIEESPDLHFIITLWSTQSILERFRYSTNPARIADAFISRDLGFIVYSNRLAGNIRNEVVSCPTVKSLKIAPQILACIPFSDVCGIHRYLIKLEGTSCAPIRFTYTKDAISWAHVPCKTQDRCVDCNVLLYDECLLANRQLYCGRCNNAHRHYGNFVRHPRSFPDIVHMLNVPEKTQDILLAGYRYCSENRTFKLSDRCLPVDASICGTMLKICLVPDIRSIFDMRNIEQLHFIIASE